MKNLDRKSNEIDSPKTPGGISKSLLTPIRRLGLSRKWKKPGNSPFVSPLAGNIVQNNINEGEEKPSRKRKLCAVDEAQNLPSSSITNSEEKNIEINSTPPPLLNADTENTPVKRVATSRKKRKSLISSPISCDNIEDSITTKNQNNSKVLNTQKSNNYLENKQAKDTEPKEKCNNKINNKSSKKVEIEERSNNTETKLESIKSEDDHSQLHSKEMSIIKPKVPNLSKECIVVIQKKIFTPANNETDAINKEDVKENNSISQVLFDSDSDDVPLSTLNKKDQDPENFIKSLDDDDLLHKKINNLRGEHKGTSKNTSSTSKKVQSSKTTEEKTSQIKKQTSKGKIGKVQVDLTSQKSNHFDDDDDDFEVNKKTILIRRSYDKVRKPSKSKSTGSITQKDIDEIKARIEMKKKLLIAKSMTKETEELRGLIKKWQKGCQDALMELLELMRKKIPDQSNMNYSYILEMLKIPPSLVGYNEENECFSTPDDDSILTAAFNDL